MERARDGVVILWNDVWHSALIDFGCVSSRILFIKVKFSSVKVLVVARYGPNEGNGEVRDRFCNDIYKIMNRVDNGYRLCIL